MQEMPQVHREDNLIFEAPNHPELYMIKKTDTGAPIGSFDAMANSFRFIDCGETLQPFHLREMNKAATYLHRLYEAIAEEEQPD